MVDYVARTHFGLPADPWAGKHHRTADVARAAILVNAAASAQGMVRIVGQRGMGKTHAVRQALAERASVRVVEPIRLDREKLHLGDIQAAIVRDLSDERPRLSGEARSGQVRRILGTAVSRPPVLLIDDAHALHHATLKGLKRLRELSYRGVSPLIGVILIGQADPARSTPEVALRSDRTVFAGLTGEDVRRAVAAAINRDREVVSAGALGAIEQSERARNWLDLQALIDACLARAASRGAPKVGAEHVAAALRPGARAARKAAPPAPSADGAVNSVLGGAKRAVA